MAFSPTSCRASYRIIRRSRSPARSEMTRGRQAAHRANLRRQGLARARARRVRQWYAVNGLDSETAAADEALKACRQAEPTCTLHAIGNFRAASAPIEHGQAPCRRSLLRCDHRRAGVFPVAARQAACSRIETHTKSFAGLLGYLRIPLVITLERPVSRRAPLPRAISRRLPRQQFGADVRKRFFRPDQRIENTGITSRP